MIPVGREEDTRKVQTAVLGGPDGHRPLFLPFEKHAANGLRQKHGPNAFTCGVLLGGCGKLLTLRACDDKKSHFAHRPPVRCTRTALGEDSADHLYIGEALVKWLRGQGRSKVSVQYVRQKGARSDSIEVRFGPQKKRRLIHVQMARRSFTEWQADGERLSAAAGEPSTIRMYGPESQLAAFEIDAAGYAVRFECVTENGTRVVRVGTHPPDHQVTWTTLDRCRLVPAGILTPWLEETPQGIRPKGARSALRPEDRPVADVRKTETARKPVNAGDSGPGPELPLVTGSVAFTGAALVSEEQGRGLYDVDAQPIGSAMLRARLSLPASTAAPEPHRVYVLTGRPVVLSGPQLGISGSRWMLRAEHFVCLTPANAAEWDLLKPPAPTPDKRATADATTSSRGPEQSRRKPVSPVAPDMTEPPDVLRTAERPAPARAVDIPALPPAVPGENPLGRLHVILRHLDAAEAGLPTPTLHKVVREADDLALLIGSRFLPTPVSRSLKHWRTVLRQRQEGVTPDSPPREVFDRLADEFRAARDAGDLPLAKRIRREMGRVYALRLTPQDREAVTGLVRAFKQWVRDQEPMTPADESLKALRRILHDLGSRRAAVTTEEIAAALEEADRIRRELDGPLPEAVTAGLRRWRGNLRYRQEKGNGNSGQLPDTRTLDPVDRTVEPALGEGRAVTRLDREALEPLASRVRTLLQDAARAGTTMTWRDLRRRMGGELPYLHPDDQGEILVMVDRETPANEPLLAALAAGADLSPHALYRHVRYSLGRKCVPEMSLEMHWRIEVFQLYQLWRHR
ncbi:hypothetical protein ACFWGR_11100 [Streptomyces sp. NPDC060311]|uniref:hypothetical protein n=1 Tax=Streptomyces sp. NPDC060311 TaxID=3347096 RepID=UPI00364C09FC